MIRVLLIGNARLVSGSLNGLLVNERDIEVIGHVPFDSQVPHLVAERHPRVVVVNTDYMVAQVLPVVAELRTNAPRTRVLILVEPGRPGMLPPRRQALDVSFLVRGASGGTLARSIRRVAAGERVVDPILKAAILCGNRLFTTREMEVLGLAAEGSPVTEIADRLRLTPGTVRNYLSSAIAKIGARNRIDAIRLARRDGWLR